MLKCNMSCLADSSGAFCLVVEESWDVPAPTQTVRGTTPTCYEWYVIDSGDSCVDDRYSMVFDYFRRLKPFVDAACDNIWAGYP